jgi:hypothetical protein
MKIKHSEETKQQMSLSKIGKHHSKETKMKMSISHPIPWNIKKIKAYNYKTGEFIGVYSSCEEASKVLKINRGNIGSVLSKKRKHAGGYIFELE